MTIEQDLFHAIYAEHAMRTGHDVYKTKNCSWINCDVCLHLNSIKKYFEDLEKRFYAELERQPKPRPESNVSLVKPKIVKPEKRTIKTPVGEPSIPIENIRAAVKKARGK